MAKHWLVTVRLPKNPNHDPKNKVAGPCPVTGGYCDDVTGEHHTVLVSTPNNGDGKDVREFWAEKYHVTRVEEVLV